MKNLNQFKSCKKSELMLMIAIAKTIQFFNAKFGEFIISFLLVCGPAYLLFGNNPIVWLVALPAHFLSLLIMSKVRTDVDKKELHDELQEQVLAFKSFLKEKSVSK